MIISSETNTPAKAMLSFLRPLLSAFCLISSLPFLLFRFVPFYIFAVCRGSLFPSRSSPGSSCPCVSGSLPFASFSFPSCHLLLQNLCRLISSLSCLASWRQSISWPRLWDQPFYPCSDFPLLSCQQSLLLLMHIYGAHTVCQASRRLSIVKMPSTRQWHRQEAVIFTCSASLSGGRTKMNGQLWFGIKFLVVRICSVIDKVKTSGPIVRGRGKHGDIDWTHETLQ